MRAEVAGVDVSAAPADALKQCKSVTVSGALVLVEGRWCLEAHWQPTGHAGGAGRAVMLDWSCASCTIKNGGAASVCRTCGARAPQRVFTSRPDAPAPLWAVLSPDACALRGAWSRGGARGGFLAVREVAIDGFASCPWVSPAHAVVPEPVFTCGAGTGVVAVVPNL